MAIRTQRASSSERMKDHPWFLLNFSKRVNMFILHLYVDVDDDGHVIDVLSDVDGDVKTNIVTTMAKNLPFLVTS